MPNPATPPGLKILRADKITGLDSRGKRPPSIANLPRAIPQVPSVIASSPLAMLCWNWVTPTLQRVHLLHEGSVLSLIGLCCSFEAYMTGVADLRAGRITNRTFVELSRDWRSWCGRFGLDPAAEGVLAKMADDIPDADDPFL